MSNEYSLKKVMVFVIFIVALVAIPLTVYLAQRQQESRSRASVVGEDAVVAVIDGVQITKAQVRKVAEENYAPGAVDAQALKDALDILSERRILDKAAKELGIKVDQDKANNLLDQEFSTTDAHYEALRDQVRSKVVKGREAVSIAFWNPPTKGSDSLTAEEKTAAAKQLTEGTAALAEAETRMKAGEDVFDIADSLLAKYPSLAPVLAVNGYVLDILDDSERELASHPRMYEFGDSGLDPETLESLFALELDEITRITDTSTNRGGVVFKLISANDAGAVTYGQWLEGQKTSLVQNLSVL